MSDSGDNRVLGRIGARDLNQDEMVRVSGGMTLSTLMPCTFDGKSTDGLRRWVQVSLASDAMDTVSGAISAQHVGLAGSLQATAASIPFVAGGWWALRRLPASKQDA